MHNKIIEWKRQKREEWNKLNMRGYNLSPNESFGVCSDNTIWDKDDIFDHFFSQLPSLLELLEVEVGEEEDVHWNDIGTPELIAKQSEIYGRNQERQRLHTLIHEAQSSLK